MGKKYVHKEATVENVDKYVTYLRPADDFYTLIGDEKVYGVTLGGISKRGLEWFRDVLRARAVELFTRLDVLHSQFPGEDDEPTQEALDENAWIGHEIITAWTFAKAIDEQLEAIAAGKVEGIQDPRGSFAEQLAKLLGDEPLSDEEYAGVSPAPTIN